MPHLAPLDQLTEQRAAAGHGTAVHDRDLGVPDPLRDAAALAALDALGVGITRGGHQRTQHDHADS